MADFLFFNGPRAHHVQNHRPSLLHYYHRHCPHPRILSERFTTAQTTVIRRPLIPRVVSHLLPRMRVDAPFCHGSARPSVTTFESAAFNTGSKLNAAPWKLDESCRDTIVRRRGVPPSSESFARISSPCRDEAKLRRKKKAQHCSRMTRRPLGTEPTPRRLENAWIPRK